MLKREQLRLSYKKERPLRPRKRKNHNQYFTPEFVVEKALSFIPINCIKKVIDPAVGNGAFLKVAGKKWKSSKLFGIDIDTSIIKRLKDTKQPNFHYIVGNSLWEETWKNSIIRNILLSGGFDLVIGNPPFSSWFHRVEDPSILSSYILGYKNGKLLKSQAIEVLFLEIFINLASPNGYIVIVVPDGVLSNPQYSYVRDFILSNTKVLRVISLPRYIFEETSAKTSVMVLEKVKANDLNYSASISFLTESGIINSDFKVNGNLLRKRMDYEYYHHSKSNSFNHLLEKGYRFAPLSQFLVYCKTGRTLYGKRRAFSEKGLRFLHATNVTEIGINYEKDPKFIDPASPMFHSGAYAKKGDIVFVRVGVGCAGKTAMVADIDDEGVATDYLHIFRVTGINPYFLVGYLKSKYGMDSIQLLKHGVATVSINKTDLLSLPIPLVGYKAQGEIGTRYKKILKRYRSNPEDDVKLRSEMSGLISSLEHMLGDGNLGQSNYSTVRFVEKGGRNVEV